MRVRTIRARIQFTFAVAVVGFALALGYGITQVRELRAELDRVRDHYLPMSVAIGQMGSIWDRPIDRERVYALQGRSLVLSLRNSLQVRFAFLDRSLNETRDHVASLRDSAAGETERNAIAGVADALDAVGARDRKLGTDMGAFFDAVLADDRALADERYAQLERTRAELREEIDRASAHVDIATRSAIVAAGNHAASALLALAILTGVALLFGLVASGVVGRALRPLGQLVEGTRKIGQGEFGGDIALPKRAGEEIATLAHEFNQMVARLRARDESLRAIGVHLESILEGIRSGLVVLDPEGKITRVNRAAEEIWGRPRADLVGRGLDAVPGAEAFADRAERVREHGKPARIAAVAVRRGNGANGSGAPPAADAAEGEGGRLVDVTLIPFEDGLIVVGDDVTERSQMERALVRSEKLAAIGRMSSQITHEVRNPLNSLSLNLELLEDELRQYKDKGVDTEEAWRIIKALTDEAERLNEVTEGYLGFARLPRPQMVRGNLEGVVEDLLAFIRQEVTARGVDLEVHLAGDLPEVLADENQIRQALLNIIRNALDAMEAGGSLEVSTRTAGGAVEVVISDTGPGIDVRDLNRIFDPFYSTKDSGTGVGLPLTQQIIEEHDGTITCESERGKGTTFIVRLPQA